MKKTGFYIIKDNFFEDMSEPYLKGNNAGNRPHYYCYLMKSTDVRIENETCTDHQEEKLYWLPIDELQNINLVPDF